MEGFICDRLVATCVVGLKEAQDLYSQFFAKKMLLKYKDGVDDILIGSEDEELRKIPVKLG